VTTPRRGRRLPRFLQRFVQKWARRRQGPDGDCVELHQGRVYILPTRSGLVFGLVFFTMLLGALNYGNNMGFALAFLLTAVAVVSIHHCQRNLSGLRVSVSGCDPVFAGEPMECTLHVTNPGPGPRWQIAAGPAAERTPAVDLPPNGSAMLTLRLATARRGVLRCPEIRLSTRHPLGLFECWALLYPERELLVYPRPAASAEVHLPPATADLENTGESVRGTDEFVGLRPPQPGESLSRIAWKAWARTGQLLAKDYRSGAGSAWLEWNAIPAADPEARLSCLTRMIIDAKAGGQLFGLRLPGIELPPMTGQEHFHKCLALLATFDTASDPPARRSGSAHAH
jgi:uncharacterized protein (DUF58 family)